MARDTFNEVNEKLDGNEENKADRAMPKKTSTGEPTKTRRIPSRDFGYEGANIKFNR